MQPAYETKLLDVIDVHYILLKNFNWFSKAIRTIFWAAQIFQTIMVFFCARLARFTSKNYVDVDSTLILRLR